MNNLIFVRTLIYRLKRAYGLPLDIYRITSSTTDRATGQKIQEKTKYHIDRAIVLPNQVQKKFAFDVMNKTFSYGAEYLANLRDIIIDARDLPKDFELTINDYIIYDGKRYQIKIFEVAEHNQAYLIRMDHAPGSLPYEQHDVQVRSALDLNQGVSNES